MMAMNQQNFWNQRYADEYYAYGTLPNDYLKEKSADLRTGYRKNSASCGRRRPECRIYGKIRLGSRSL